MSKVNLPYTDKSRFSKLLPYGLAGTLAFSGALILVNPALAAIVAAVPLTYLAADKLLLPLLRLPINKMGVTSRTSQSSYVPSGDYGHLDVSEGKKTGVDIVDALVAKLRDNGLQVSTDWKTAKKLLKSLPDKYDSVKQNIDSIHGFVYRGTIFINPKDTGPDVPIHEYTHVWAECLRQHNPDNWNSIKKMLKRETAIWREVKATYPHLVSDDEIADEVLATFSGRQGAERIKEHCRHGETPDEVFSSLLKALEQFWKNVLLFFKADVSYCSIEDVADRVLADFLTDINPNRYINGNVSTLSDKVPLVHSEPVEEEISLMNEHITDTESMTAATIEEPVDIVADVSSEQSSYDDIPDESLIQISPSSDDEKNQDYENWSKAVYALVERVTDPSARSFTEEQRSLIENVLIDSNTIDERKKVTRELYNDAMLSLSDNIIPSAWKEDLSIELNELSEGKIREHNRGLHL